MRNMRLLSVLRDRNQETFRSLFAEGAEPKFEHRSGKAKGVVPYIHPMSIEQTRPFVNKYFLPKTRDS